MQIITLRNSETLAYSTYGTGDRVLILVHGNLSAGVHFKPLLRYIPSEYTVYIPDMRGFGTSSYNTPIHCIKDLAEDLFDLIEQLGIKKAALLGWSAGGCVCMQFAAAHPEAVGALLLIESVGYKGCPLMRTDEKPYRNSSEMANEPTQIKPALEAIRQRDAVYMDRLWKQAIFVNTRPNEVDMARFVTASLKQRNLVDFYWALANFNISCEHNGFSIGTGEISKITAPVLLIWGRQDCIVSLEETMQTKDALSQGKIVVLEHTGHAPFVDCPDVLIKQIADFMLEYEVY